jgi:hypothetical protein
MTSYYEGKAKQSVEKENERIAIIESQEASADYGEQVESLIGAEKTLYAKAGVDITSGSPLLQIARTREEGEKAKRKIETLGEMEAAKHRYAGGYAAKAGNMAIMGSAAETGMTIASMMAGGIAGGMGGGGMAGAAKGAVGGIGGGGWGMLLNSLSATSRPQIR